VGEQIIGVLDLVERETVCDKGSEIGAAGGHRRHQPAHPLSAAGAERGDDLVITDAGRKGFRRWRSRARRICAASGAAIDGPSGAGRDWSVRRLTLASPLLEIAIRFISGPPAIQHRDSVDKPRRFRLSTFRLSSGERADVQEHHR
jgi:hypothetical protein